MGDRPQKISLTFWIRTIRSVMIFQKANWSRKTETNPMILFFLVNDWYLKRYSLNLNFHKILKTNRDPLPAYTIIFFSPTWLEELASAQENACSSTRVVSGQKSKSSIWHHIIKKRKKLKVSISRRIAIVRNRDMHRLKATNLTFPTVPLLFLTMAKRQ